MEALVVLLARAVVLLSNALAADDAVVGVGETVMSADWLKEVVGALALVKGRATAQLLELNIFAFESAEVVIGLSVVAADLVNRFFFTGAAPAVLPESRSLALQSAVVVKLLPVGAANRGDGAWAIGALVIVGRARAVEVLAEALAAHQTLIVISDAIFAANWLINIRAVFALRVVDEAGAVLLEDGSLALEDAHIVVGLLVGSADRVVVVRAVGAVVFIRALPTAFQGDAATLAETLIEVGPPVDAALGPVNLGAVLAIGGVQIAEPVVKLPDALAVEQALVVIGDPVGPADGNIGQGLRASTVGKLPLIL